MEKYRQLPWRKIVICICIVASLVLGGSYIYEKYTTHVQEVKAEELRLRMEEEAAAREAARLAQEALAAQEREAALAALHQLASLKEVNTEAVAWLEVEGTPIAYPVAQTVDNEYYLKVSFEGERYNFGSIYMDYKNDPEFTDFNTVIYGHTFPNDERMFGALQRYREQSFWDEHNMVTVMTDKKYFDYKIFAVYVTEKDYNYRRPNYTEPGNAENFLREIQEKSLIKADIVPTIADRILTLSTCTYDFNDARYAVHAVLVGERSGLD
jgi:sortase B